MSKHHIEKITCPKCGHVSDFIVWDSINTVINPEMKAKVRTGEVFQWECPECGLKSIVDYAMLYHQMEDQIMIYHVPGDSTEAVKFMKAMKDGSESKDPLFNLVEGIYTKNRVVGSLNDLREKLMILDAGLDDRVMELMKVFIIGRLSENDPDVDIKELLFESNEDCERSFAVRIGDDRWGKIGFPEEMYDAIAAEFKELIEQDSEVVIDINWAVAALKKEN